MYVLAAGFLIGMRHALDADHLAAIAVLLADKPSASIAIRQGVIWGIGHSTTLLLVGLLMIVADVQLSERLAHYFELAVGVMLVGLGLDLIRRWRHRASSPQALHSDKPHSARALGVGFMHGLAGSSALILLTLSTLNSATLALAYVALFGLGSIVGMAALSAALAVPLRMARLRTNRVFDVTRFAASIASIALGGVLVNNALSSL